MSRPLFIFTHPPINNSQSREGVEALLACAAFDLEPDVLLIDQAVFQLMPQNDQTGVKNLHKMIQAFEIYGVHTLFVCTDSISRFGLEHNQLKPEGKRIAPPQRINLIKNASWVVRF